MIQVMGFSRISIRALVIFCFGFTLTLVFSGKKTRGKCATFNVQHWLDRHHGRFA